MIYLWGITIGIQFQSFLLTNQSEKRNTMNLKLKKQTTLINHHDSLYTSIIFLQCTIALNRNVSFNVR